MFRAKKVRALSMVAVAVSFGLAGAFIGKATLSPSTKQVSTSVPRSILLAPYPEEWKVDPASAADAASFEVIVPPENSDAATRNAANAFVDPSGTRVIYSYPPQDETKLGTVRRDEIEIEENFWGEDYDSTDYWAEAVENSPGDAQITEIEGRKALTIEPNSKSDAEAANVAFVQFVVDGVEVTISGGPDLDYLLKIAGDLIS